MYIQIEMNIVHVHWKLAAIYNETIVHLAWSLKLDAKIEKNEISERDDIKNHDINGHVL